MIEDDQRPLATLSASPARRVLGLFVILLLAVILLVLAARGGSAVSAICLAGLGLSCIWTGYRMHAATRAPLELHETGLFAGDGTLIAEIRNISGIERGMFAMFKPSNGFVLMLKQPMKGSWNPGLWWRLGKRVGVGGITHQADGRILAESIALLIDESNPSNS